MTEQEVQAFCANNGISVSAPGEALHVVNPDELPPSVRRFVNDDGSYKGDGTPEAEDGKSKVAEFSDQQTQLKGKLPDDFPGKAALEAEGITTYAKLRKAGDVTEVPGIGPATKAKIDEALSQSSEADEEKE